jgi:hypothetical protein
MVYGWNDMWDGLVWIVVYLGWVETVEITNPTNFGWSSWLGHVRTAQLHSVMNRDVAGGPSPPRSKIWIDLGYTQKSWW